jgi:ABC-2 type transport system permease protein
MDYIVPGVILMSVISHSYSNVVSSFYSTKFQHHIEELLVAPVPNWVILSGYVCGGIARGVLVGGVVALISMIFTQVTVLNWPITLTVLILTSTLFALAGFINAVFADSFDDISIIPNFVLTPLSYLGGVFYSLAMLPPIWQLIAQGNPILYMINAFRFQMTTGFILFLSGLSLFLLHKGIGIKN